MAAFHYLCPSSRRHRRGANRSQNAPALSRPLVAGPMRLLVFLGWPRLLRVIKEDDAIARLHFTFLDRGSFLAKGHSGGGLAHIRRDSRSFGRLGFCLNNRRSG